MARIFCPEMVRVAPVKGCVRPVSVRDPVALSTSVSLVMTAIRNGVSSLPVCVESSLAIGASLVQLTVIVPVATLLPAGPKVSAAW